MVFRERYGEERKREERESGDSLIRYMEIVKNTHTQIEQREEGLTHIYGERERE